MKNFEFIKKGRKWFFTLSLFLLVFAAASAVKIHAAGNVTGWLWGGSEDANLVPPPLGSIDGNDTMVYWVSMNKSNCDSNNDNLTDTVNYPDCPVNQPSNFDYGVTIPNSGEELSGYAWSPNLGYLSFNKGELGDCPAANPADCRAWRDGNTLKGWARFMEFKINAAQAGGWGGWVSLSNSSAPKPYGVVIEGDTFEKCDPRSGSTLGCAWSGETLGTGGNIADGLGWIDFSQAKYTPACSIASVDPTTPPVYLKEPSNKCQPITVTLKDVSGNKTVNFAVNPTGVVKISKNSDCSISSDGFSLTVSDNNPHKVYVSSTSYSALANASIEISGDCGTSPEAVQVIKTPSCTLNCPSEVIISSGKTKSVKSEISVTGDSECASLVTCSESGTDSKGNISVSNDCNVSETEKLRYGSSELTATAGSGSDSCTAPINVKGPGWIETNP